LDELLKGAGCRSPRTSPGLPARLSAASAPGERADASVGYDILRRDLTARTLTSSGCTVLSGSLNDPYTGTTLSFTRGKATSSQVQIDHVVALADAWAKGARSLTLSQRTAIANDPLNLQSVTGTVNEKKGSGDAATWLPPRKAFRCSYVAQQIAVKRTYRLWVTRAEHNAMARILSSSSRCRAQLLPTFTRLSPPPVVADPVPLPTASPSPTSIASPSPTATTEPTTPSTPSPTATPTQTSSADPRFGTCKAAKAAGYGPYYRGLDPEYGWYRDADNDGTVCE
jgi:hypothetical protein